MPKLDQPLTPPTTSLAEATRAVVAKGTAGSLPLIGSFASEAVGAMVTIPIQRRQEKFFADICCAIEDLRDKAEIDWPALLTDESFSATVATIALAVAKTTEQEKLAALRAATLNSIGVDRPDEAVRHRLVAAIDSCTAAHLALLGRLKSDTLNSFVSTVGRSSHREMPTTWRLEDGGIVPLRRNVPPRELIAMLTLVADLVQLGFVNRSEVDEARASIGGDYAPIDNDIHVSYSITELGEDFLDFVDTPVSEQASPPK